MDGADRPGVKAAHTTLAVLEAVAELDGAGVSELARHLDRSKGGVYKHVRTLTDRGFLVTDGTTYHLGLALWTLGTDVRNRLVPPEVESVIDDLAASTGHVVTFVGYERSTAAVVYYQVPARATVQPYPEGESLPLHATAAGKAILAYLPEPEREAHLDDELQAYTETTLVDPNPLAAELQKVRESRIARDRGEYRQGVDSAAAPIIDDEGYPQGSITVTTEIEQGVEEGLEADTSLIVSASKSLENVLTN